MKKPKRATIPVFKKTYDTLRRQKLEVQLKIDKNVTWDDFLLKKCKGVDC